LFLYITGKELHSLVAVLKKQKRVLLMNNNNQARI